MYKPTTILLLSMVVALACTSRDDEARLAEGSPAAADKADTSRIHVMSVDEVDQALARGECTVLDANQRPVRIRNGTIPGATLLSHYQNYKLDELPAAKERTLVFYCANDMCRASDAAAKKARRAGYTDVNVLRAGIKGWARAGKHTRSVP